jgi:hypothetical protein
MEVLCQTYTCLVDIDRQSVDGRSMDLYKKWLRNTIKLYPGIIVFCESIDSDLKDLDAKFYKIDRKLIFKDLEKVISVTRNFDYMASEDVTFLLPSYALLQFYKFDLGQIAKNMSGARSLLWVDAGISRFVDATNNSILQNNAKFLINKSYKFAFEIDLRNNIKVPWVKVVTPKIGNCTRIISGTSFWINSDSVELLLRATNKIKNDWLEAGIWDNEQVALRYVLKSKEILYNSYFIAQGNNQTGSIARQFSHKIIKERNLSNKLVRHILK